MGKKEQYPVSNVVNPQIHTHTHTHTHTYIYIYIYIYVVFDLINYFIIYFMNACKPTIMVKVKV
jgi:hypothetical protein